MITVAKGYMPVMLEELDQDPWLLNCPNGIIDLHTGKLMPHDPEKNMTKMIDAEYIPRAKCPTFESFIDGVFSGNKNVIEFMQRFLGYCLTGDTREQQFVIAHGSGRNGKGTLLNLITEILADYAKTTPTDVLYSKKFDKASNDIARLSGARFVLASEGEKGKKFDEPLIKKMTGQDMLAARFLYRETFEFMPQFKLVLMTNDKPVASEEDAALWSRIQLVPFVNKFEGANQDKNLKYRLREPKETAGILQWLISGCLEWQRIGLNPPEEVVHATREYRSENDKLQDWIDECCCVNENAVSSSTELYRNFQAWSLENGERFILIRKNFVKSLIRKGFQQFTGTGNYQKMHGIALLAQVDEVSSNRENPF
jgi:putative DNA primase/helicase